MTAHERCRKSRCPYELRGGNHDKGGPCATPAKTVGCVIISKRLGHAWSDEESKYFVFSVRPFHCKINCGSFDAHSTFGLIHSPALLVASDHIILLLY